MRRTDYMHSHLCSHSAKSYYILAILSLAFSLVCQPSYGQRSIFVCPWWWDHDGFNEDRIAQRNYVAGLLLQDFSEGQPTIIEADITPCQYKTAHLIHGQYHDQSNWQWYANLLTANQNVKLMPGVFQAWWDKQSEAHNNQKVPAWKWLAPTSGEINISGSIKKRGFMS